MKTNFESGRLPIAILLIIALMLTMAPLPDWAAAFRPNWVALTLLYWAMTLPHNYSVGTAWIVGLVLDVAQGTLLGQHALALCFIVFVTVKFHLQLVKRHRVTVVTLGYVHLVREVPAVARGNRHPRALHGRERLLEFIVGDDLHLGHLRPKALVPDFFFLELEWRDPLFGQGRGNAVG